MFCCVAFQLSNATVEVEDFKAKDDLMLEKLDKKEEEIKMLRLLINQSAEAEGSEGSQQSLQDALKNSSELENQLKCLQEALVIIHSVVLLKTARFNWCQLAI